MIKMDVKVSYKLKGSEEVKSVFCYGTSGKSNAKLRALNTISDRANVDIKDIFILNVEEIGGN